MLPDRLSLDNKLTIHISLVQPDALTRFPKFHGLELTALVPNGIRTDLMRSQEVLPY